MRGRVLVREHVHVWFLNESSEPLLRYAWAVRNALEGRSVGPGSVPIGHNHVTGRTGFLGELMAFGYRSRLGEAGVGEQPGPEANHERGWNDWELRHVCIDADRGR